MGHLQGDNIIDDTLRYKGFIDTPDLWTGSLLNLRQFCFIDKNNLGINDRTKFMRLGLLTEQFFFKKLKSIPGIRTIAKNLQIIQDNKTVGEIDCLLLKRNMPIHVELVYKFYLFDPAITGNEIDKWIGPNRNDSLNQKIKKLTEKQLPLINHKKTQEIIHSLGHNSSSFEQGVSFKAQLFIPQGFDEKKIKLLNRKCIIGAYIRLNEMNEYADHSFYIPQKLDWLIAPHSDVKWLSFKDCISVVQDQHLLKRSVMIWIKSKTSLKKCFVVFWN